MKKNQIVVTVVLLIIGMILIAGCIVSHSPENRTTISTSAIATLTPQSVPTQCPPESGNATPYIIINPIGNHTVGDVFEINGTTNLGVDSKIVLSLRGLIALQASQSDTSSPYAGPVEYVTIRQNICGPNSWSLPVNLSGFRTGYHTGDQAYLKFCPTGWNEPYYSVANRTCFYVYPHEGQPLTDGEVS